MIGLNIRRPPLSREALLAQRLWQLALAVTSWDRKNHTDEPSPLFLLHPRGRPVERSARNVSIGIALSPIMEVIVKSS
jgi:hypothetical protein